MCKITEPHVPLSYDSVVHQKTKAQLVLERAKEIEAKHKRRAIRIPFGFKLIKITK